MRLSGLYEFDAPAAKVWAALTGPKSLSGCIQGCESLDSVGENQYTAVMNVGVGPIRGKYNANVAMANLSPHQSFRLSVQGKGAMGFVDGHADITLEERQGKTTVRVDADSQVGGAVARVGQRLMETVAKTMMDQFFNCMRRSVS